MRVDRVVITGGAGFIGSNTAEHYLLAGARVTILDNFSRRGSESNAEWLQQSSPPGRLTIVRADVRSDHDALSRAIDGADVVFHLAAQVAVTTSVTNPREDFEINALGTFNVLEAVRTASSKPIVVYSSTNKVYGKMGDAGVIAREGRYEYEDFSARRALRSSSRHGRPCEPSRAAGYFRGARGRRAPHRGGAETSYGARRQERKFCTLTWPSPWMRSRARRCGTGAGIPACGSP